MLLRSFGGSRKQGGCALLCCFAQAWPRWLLGLVLVIGCSLLVRPASAEAAITCRTVHQREICILSIQRSAKYHWEYRATVSIDGQEHPLQKYNCRRRVRISPEGKPVPFEAGGAGDLICGLVNR